LRSRCGNQGLGLQACSGDGTTWRLGSAAWVRGGGETAASPEDEEGVWFGPVGIPWVGFELDEGLRDGALDALRQLRARGIRVVMLSGDASARVQAMASRLGLDGAIGGATPEAKLAALTAAQANGHVVAMAGDGLNDAPVLARADVSFALAHGAALAQAQADAVLLGNRLADLVSAFAVARRSVLVVRQNLFWAVLYNAACIPLALLGWLPPWAAGLGMAASSLVVVLNSLRLARLTPEPAPA
jgi:Cu2+-exporting ATPase